SVTNPIDTTGAIASDQTMLTDALRVCVDNPDTDVAMILLGNLEAEEQAICERIVEVAAATDKPVLVAWVGGSGRPQRYLSEHAVPTFSDPVRAMRAAAALVQWSTAAPVEALAVPRASEPAEITRAAAAGARILDEVDSKGLL